VVQGVPMTTLFAVTGSVASPAEVHALGSLGLQERAHLQEWVLAHPEVLGEDVLVITSEYDRWAGSDGTRARDRLDVLGLDASGRLVVVELKRDESGGDVHLQAITYAGLVSRFDLETLAEAHHAYLSSRGVRLALSDASSRILEHVGGELDPDLLSRPRLVLVAGSFPRQVTHTAVWLSEMGLDVSLVQVTAWKVDHQILVGFTKVYPTPQVEEFTLAPARAETRQVARKVEERSRAATTVQRLVAAKLLDDGVALRLVPTHGTNPQTRLAIEEWVAEMPERGQATWRNDASAPLLWGGDGNGWKPTTLARHILTEAAGTDAPVRGPSWWVTEDGVDLAGLADGDGGRRDWSDLHDLLERIPAGRWTTYGDLAAVIGTHANPLGQHVTRCSSCANAYRVLAHTGRTASRFRWEDPTRTDDVEDVLAGEGVRFDGGVADRGQRLGPEDLKALVRTAPMANS